MSDQSMKAFHLASVDIVGITLLGRKSASVPLSPSILDVHITEVTLCNINSLGVTAQAIILVDVSSVSMSFGAGWIAGIGVRQLHPVHVCDPRQVAVCVCEYPWVLGTVGDFLVKDEDVIARFGHRKGPSECILRFFCVIRGDPSCDPASRVSKKEATGLTWIQVALGSGRIEGAFFCFHPGGILTRRLFYLKL